MNLRQIIYLTKKKISLLLIQLFIKLNFHTLIALILIFNLRKIKIIKANKIKKKVIVFSKSGGIEDLSLAYQNYKNNNIEFYELSRGLIKKIFKHFIKDSIYQDYYTIDYNSLIKERKIEYKKFIYKVFQKLNFFWKFDACISFNLFYYAENDLPEPIQKLGKKFIVVHKESVNSPEESDINLQTYSNKNKKFHGDKVAVYSENEKQLLIKSGILKTSQIVVTGCSRSDYSYKLRSISPSKNIIIYYMLENIWTHEKKPRIIVDWTDLIIKINEVLKILALKNPNLKIIYKGKSNTHTIKDFPNNLPPNCIFTTSNSGEKYLKKANIVIALNSTMVFESILANRNVIIPFFDVNKKKVINFISRNPKNLFCNTKKEFFDKVSNYLNLGYKNKPMTKDEEKSVKFYLGNIDGKSGKRLRDVISSNI